MQMRYNKSYVKEATLIQAGEFNPRNPLLCQELANTNVDFVAQIIVKEND